MITLPVPKCKLPVKTDTVGKKKKKKRQISKQMSSRDFGMKITCIGHEKGTRD